MRASVRCVFFVLFFTTVQVNVPAPDGRCYTIGRHADDNSGAYALVVVVGDFEGGNVRLHFPDGRDLTICPVN